MHKVESSLSSPHSHGNFHKILNPLAPTHIFVEANMASISETISVNISKNPNVIENVLIRANCSPKEIKIYTNLFKEFRDVFTWSYEEMFGIDCSIVQHEVNTYENTKPVHKNLWLVNPRKPTAINGEVEKLLKAGFIYLVPLTKWVLNPVPMGKKQGTIHVCIDFKDLNKCFPKDNFPIPFIDQIIDGCAGNEIVSFMDGFSRYNQIIICHKDQHKMAFICPWGTFVYRKMPSGLQNVGATFQ